LGVACRIKKRSCRKYETNFLMHHPIRHHPISEALFLCRKRGQM
jgi:hypothetical protein